MSSAREFEQRRSLNYGSDDEKTKERLRELMLFIADRCQDDPDFGVTKLNKILYYCDFTAFANLGEPITGVPYTKLQYGPAPHGAQNARRRMVEDEQAILSQEGYAPFASTRLVPRRRANLTLFSGPEVALVDEVIAELKGLSAAQVSELSHGKAWETVGYNEPIPYEAAFISDEPPTEEAVARAHELIALGELED